MDQHTVVIAHQDELWRSMAARAVRRDPRLSLAGAVGDAAALRALLGAASAPQVSLIATDLPGDGPSLIARLREAGLVTRVVAICPAPGPAAVEQARAAGADGCLTRAASTRLLCATALSVATGGESFACGG